MLRIKINILLLAVSILYCSQNQYELPEPEMWIQELETSVQKYYFFNENITDPLYFKAMQSIDPDIKNLSPLNAKEYFIEFLRQNYNKEPQIAENYYRKAAYELLKHLKGRNIFIVPSTLSRLNNKENNAGTGIVLFEESPGKFLIIDVIEGSPAYLAEIKPNQYLQAINGNDIDALFLEDVVAKIKGKAKTKIQLTIQGNSYELYRNRYTYQLLRKTQWHWKNKNILYVQIRFAIKGVAELLKQYLFENTNIDAMILDIRYLSQGEIEEIFTIVDLFISKMDLMKVQLKGNEPIIFSSDHNILYTGKVIILHQEKSTPFAYALARLMNSNPNAIIIGPKKEIPVYIGKRITLQKHHTYHGAFYLTNGKIQFLQNKKENRWISIQSYIPTYPPSSRPNLEDPYHKKILEILSQWN